MAASIYLLEDFLGNIQQAIETRYDFLIAFLHY